MSKNQTTFRQRYPIPFSRATQTQLNNIFKKRSQVCFLVRTSPREALSKKERRRDSPNIIALAVGLAVSHETGALFIQKLLTLGTFQTCRVPFQIRCYPQDPLIVDSTAAADAEGTSAF